MKDFRDIEGYFGILKLISKDFQDFQRKFQDF